MRQSLQLRLGQHLTMTPQLQQAIRLLQLSSLDLQAEIQAALDSNLMLERSDEGGEEAPPAETALTETVPAAHDRPENAPTETLPDELAVDSNWEDIYDSYDGSTSFSRNDDEDGRDLFENHGSGASTLHDHLTWQMELTPFTPSDLAIAGALIDATDESGYLTVPMSDILEGVREDFPDTEADEVEAVLHRLQHFDPPGVCARNAAECLQLQLGALPEDTPWRSEARQLVAQYLELLAGRDFNLLMRRMRLTREQLQEVIALIQSLNPHPGTQISSEQAPYVVPDVFVYRGNDGGWHVDLNPDSAPKLRINAEYARLVRRADSSADNQYLKNHLQEARWFLKSLRNRHETLLKVARCIVERQQAFFEHGPEYMRPLVLRDIAESVEMHESTISRVTTQKYMHTPRGIFELKYFFSSHVSTTDGGEASSIAIQAMIKKLIAQENVQKPYSDSKLAELLAAEGIQVARRTVAKYREAMSIPSSTDRKRIG
ncbi:RNA polymerase factor sigma-54 [Plasticicumulans acidivorans]|uniref:RNA polymerase sigma-54 factor n=1 Tax=Plasticicumulans acidivorans TaxID=886464 RepID=A0A317MV50_9GAMM|nr:RNA polymerase factor sigma-54 [Plasticicumulans acidivorans]PWV61798.1 RNA polymerase RpoN-/SigL-like sigma 54 subunit [Plasticicumulans acidivorans]